MPFRSFRTETAMENWIGDFWVFRADLLVFAQSGHNMGTTLLPKRSIHSGRPGSGTDCQSQGQTIKLRLRNDINSGSSFFLTHLPSWCAEISPYVIRPTAQTTRSACISVSLRYFQKNIWTPPFRRFSVSEISMTNLFSLLKPRIFNNA